MIFTFLLSGFGLNELEIITAPKNVTRDYSKLDLLPLLGVVKIFQELEIKITGVGNYNFI